MHTRFRFDQMDDKARSEKLRKQREQQEMMVCGHCVASCGVGYCPCGLSGGGEHILVLLTTEYRMLSGNSKKKRRDSLN